MAETDYVLELKNIRKTFGTLVANDNINLRVRRGSVHAVIGENGAGKSTLMNIITDLYEPDGGEILLNGKRIRFKDPMDATRHGIGMVYQEFMVFGDLPVLDNIMMGFEEKKWGIFLNRAKARMRIEEICRDYHFNLPLDARADTLPVAVLQQVEIVKVLYRGADILILDEPTSVLTPQGIQGLFEAIRFLKAIGKTILMITHKLREVFEVADEITVLKNGKVTGNVLPDEVTEEQLANLMVGREVILQAHKLNSRIKSPVLQLQNLSVKENGVQRLKNLNLEVRSGEIVGIAGIAGSGQQQLAGAVVGLTRVEKESRITIAGIEAQEKSVRERKKMGVGYIPQDRMKEGVNKAGSVWESAVMGYQTVRGFPRKYLLDRKLAEDFTNQIIREYSVKTKGIHEKVINLSGGNIQKLVVGREITLCDKLLVIEDPTRGIDVGAIEFIWEKILRIVAAGAGILLISHELNEVMQLSDRIFVLYNGTLEYGGVHGELKEEEIGLLMTRGGDADEKEMENQ